MAKKKNSKISNTSLAVLVLMVMVVSFFAGQVLSPVSYDSVTGFVSGKVNLTINSTVAISLPIDSVEFGIGNPPSGTNTLVLRTEHADYADYNFTTNVHSLVVENTGNVEANVTVQSSANAAEFIDAIGNAEFKFNSTENNTDTACAGTRAGTPEGNWVEFDKSQQIVCDVLNYTVDAGNTNDKLNIGIWINMSSSVPTGVKEATLTFEATESI